MESNKNKLNVPAVYVPSVSWIYSQTPRTNNICNKEPLITWWVEETRPRTLDKTRKRKNKIAF